MRTEATLLGLLVAVAWLEQGSSQRAELATLDELIRFVEDGEIDESHPFFQKPDYFAEHTDSAVIHEPAYHWKEVTDIEWRMRIAQGSGTRVQDVNQLLKRFTEAQKMMKKMQKLGPKGLKNMMGRGGMPF